MCSLNLVIKFLYLPDLISFTNGFKSRNSIGELPGLAEGNIPGLFYVLCTYRLTISLRIEIVFRLDV